MGKILAESLIWKEFFKKGTTREAIILEKLIKENKIAICGYSLIKLLKDLNDKETFKKLLKGLLVLPYVEIEKEDWIKASKIVFEFKGLSTELGLLCALSQGKSLKILTKNKGIKEIKGVKLYEDEKRLRKKKLSGVYGL